MAKDPAFLFYSSDFYTGTATMTNEHVGMYIRLLCLQHQKGRLSKKDMLCICSAYINDVFAKFEQDHDGYYINKRLQIEDLKRKEYTNSRRMNALGKHKAYAQHMENENEDININKDKNKNNKKKEEYTKDFLDFYHLYPKKVGKPKAFESWRRINLTNGLFEKIMAAVALQAKSKQWTKDGGEFIPHPATWLNQERWNDEGYRRSETVGERIKRIAEEAGHRQVR